jgi:hypothetical protein
MSDNYTLPNLLKQVTESAQEQHRNKEPVKAYGFVVGMHPSSGKKGAGIVYPAGGVHTLEDLERFAERLHPLVRRMEATVAGVICTLEVSVDGSPPRPTVMLYADQKLGGMRVLLAPLGGEDLVFQDFGTAHPLTNFFPQLFTPEHYPPTAEA